MPKARTLLETAAEVMGPGAGKPVLDLPVPSGRAPLLVGAPVARPKLDESSGVEVGAGASCLNGGSR